MCFYAQHNGIWPSICINLTTDFVQEHLFMKMIVKVYVMNIDVKKLIMLLLVKSMALTKKTF